MEEFEFEYAGHRFSYCIKFKDMVAESIVMGKTREAIEFLKNEEYGYRCFVYGRSIWLKRKESHV